MSLSSSCSTPGPHPAPSTLDVTKAVGLTLTSNGSLQVKLGTSKIDPYLIFEPPTAFQDSASGHTSRTVRLTRWVSHWFDQ